MLLRELSRNEVAARLKGDGVRVRMGPFVLKLGTTLPELIDPIHLLYHHYRVEPADAFADFDIHVGPRTLRQRLLGKHVEFRLENMKKFDPFERRIALPMLEWIVNWCVFTRPHQYLILHSAVVERHGHAVILPGQPGAGKSTLCAALNLRGWRLLSDEVAMMRAPDIQLIPVPRPIGLKEGSIDVIRRFEPTAVLGPSTPGTRKGTVAHIQVDAMSLQRASETAAPRLIVFPSWRKDAPVELKPYSKARALYRIASDAFNFSILGSTGFETLASLVDACDCHTLTYGHLDEAIATLNQLIDIAPTQDRNIAAKPANNMRLTG